MTGLLETREYIKKFCVKFDIYVNPCVKFTMALVSILVINLSMGYMPLLKNPAVVLVAALTCSFLPRNFIVLVSAIWVLLHSFSLAMECAVVVAAVFGVMFLLYFRFSPKDTLVVILTPILFVFKIPYVMPVAMGLLGGPVSAVSVSCGVITYYMVKYMADNVTIFSAMDAQTGSQKFRIMLDGILDNKAMFITIVVFCFTLFLVYAIRRLSVDYAWTVAIIGGLTASAILLLIFEFIMEVGFSVIAIVIGSIFAFVICMVIQFLEFNVDYARTERVQFEDDEYYYYVKAVPKNVVTAPEKKVKKINSQKKKVPARQEKRVSTIKTSNGVSRTTVTGEGSKKSRAGQDKQ